MKEQIVDRAFAEKFLQAVDSPFDYGVYQLFHDWWDQAPQDAIDAYRDDLMSVPGAEEFVAEGFLADPLRVADLQSCAAGSLGKAYADFIVGNGLEENLGRNYKVFNEQLRESGTLDRLPDEISFTIVRGFQIHDFLHVLTGFPPSPTGELAQAMFHFGQLRFPYHAMRLAVTTGYIAYVNPSVINPVMDALVEGWLLGRAAINGHFTRWEDELHTPLSELRTRFGIHVDGLVPA